MSFKAVDAVFEHSKTEGSVRLVLVVIADAANHEGGHAYPAIDTIARRARVCRRTVFRAIETAQEMGELVVESRAGRNGTNVYSVAPLLTRTGDGEMSPWRDVTGDTGVIQVVPSVSPKREEQNRSSSSGNANVPAREDSIAPEVLRYFGLKSGTISADDKMVELVEARIAENPELALDDHKRIIDVAFADPWWAEANPTPFVVYGKASIFATRRGKANGGPHGLHPADRRDKELAELAERLRAEGR